MNKKQKSAYIKALDETIAVWKELSKKKWYIERYTCEHCGSEVKNGESDEAFEIPPEDTNTFWDVKQLVCGNVLGGVRRNGCPMCELLIENSTREDGDDDCGRCLRWSKVPWDGYFSLKLCEQNDSPYWKWRHAESLKDARKYAKRIVRLAGKRKAEILGE